MRQALAFSADALGAAGDPEALHSAKHMVALASGLDGSSALGELRRRLAARPPLLLDEAAWVELPGLLRRRAKREPVQYILGEVSHFPPCP